VFVKQVLLKLKTASAAGAFAHPGPLFWFVGGAVIAPIVLFLLGGQQPNNLPWYFWALAITMAVGVLSAGFLRFARKPTDAEDISISPDRRNSMEP
jgi:hypothetical protein